MVMQSVSLLKRDWAVVMNHFDKYILGSLVCIYKYVMYYITSPLTFMNKSFYWHYTAVKSNITDKDSILQWWIFELSGFNCRLYSMISL